MKTGLVLEGGAMRGLFTAGVLDVLMEHHLKFDGAIGVSAGAAFGVNYKSQQIGRVLRYNLRYAHDKRLASWQSWLKTGDLYGADFCYRELPCELDVFDTAAFTKNPMSFWCVATDIQNGQPVYHKMHDGKTADLQWIRASSSIPVFARPVAIDNRYYWDGGVSDSIPLRFFQSRGYEKNIVILTQPLNYRKVDRHNFALLELLLHKYPHVLADLRTRNDDYNEVLAEIIAQEESGQTLAIRPPFALDIGTVEKDRTKIKQTYEIGRQVAEQRLPEIKAYLRHD